MESETPDDQGRDQVLSRFYALTDARHRQEREAVEALYYRRIVDTAGIDPNKLSDQGQRILRWLSEWDDWTTGGVVEILTAARTAAQMAEHRAGIAHRLDALRQSEAAPAGATDADGRRWGIGR